MPLTRHRSKPASPAGLRRVVSVSARGTLEGTPEEALKEKTTSGGMAAKLLGLLHAARGIVKADDRLRSGARRWRTALLRGRRASTT